MFIQILFYGYAAMLLMSALMVVSARNTIHSALFLVLAFFTCAALWILLRAEFLAIALVLVYVGAVMVLFLFVVMMLNLNTDLLREGFIRHLPLGILVAIVIVAEMFLALNSGGFRMLDEAALKAVDAPGYSNTRALGSVLYTRYLYAFEIAAVILLLAMVSAITLTLRRVKGTRHQNPARQVKVMRADRLRIVKMEAEPKGDTND